MDKMKKLDCFLIYVIVVSGIALLRLSVGYPKELVQFFVSFVELGESIIGYFGFTKLFYIVQKIPIKWLLLLMGSIQINIGFLVLFLFRNTWEQGTILLFKKGNDVLKIGTVLYAMTVLVIAVFVYSVVGLPIAGILLLLLYIAICIGSIPIAIFLGYLLLQQFRMKGEIYLCYMVGSFVMLLFKNVSMIGGAFLFFIFPVFALGVDMLMILYRFVYQCSLTVDSEQKQKFDRKKIRDIIKKDL